MRINPWIALVVGGALTALAANGGRIFDGISDLLAPPPATIIIVAPAGSDTV